MEFKQEDILPDRKIVISEYGNSPRIRNGKPVRIYASELKGNDLEKAFADAMNKSEFRSIIDNHLKIEKMDNNFSNENQQLNEVRFQSNISRPNENVLSVVYPAISDSFDQDCNKNLPIKKTLNGGGICKVCNKQFCTISYCKDHFILVHGETFREKNKQCLVCKQLFAFEKNLSTHMNKIHGINEQIEMVKGYGGLIAKSTSGKGVCLICCKLFCTISYCKTHFRLNHKKEGSSTIFQNKQSKLNTHAYEAKTNYNTVNIMHEKNLSKIENKVDNIVSNNDQGMKSFDDNNYKLYTKTNEMNIQLGKNSKIENRSKVINDHPQSAYGKEISFDQTRAYLSIKQSYENEREASTIVPCKIENKVDNLASNDDQGMMRFDDNNNQLYIKTNEINIQPILDTKIKNQSKVINDHPQLGYQKEIFFDHNRPYLSLMQGKENKKEANTIVPRTSLSQFSGNYLIENADRISKSKPSSLTLQSRRSEPLPVSKTLNGGGICNVCGSQFSYFTSCKRHFLQIHAESYREKNIECLVCGEAFSFESNLSVHMKKVHKISGKVEKVEESNNLFAKTSCGKGVCLVCCKVFSFMSSLKRHIKTVHDQARNSNGAVKPNAQRCINNQMSRFVPKVENAYEKCNIEYKTKCNDSQLTRNFTVCKKEYPKYYVGPQINVKGNAEYQHDNEVDCSVIEVKSEPLFHNK